MKSRGTKSDCRAIKGFHERHHVTATAEESVALAVKNGCDLNCGDIYPRLLEAVKQGLVGEKDITRAVQRLFTEPSRIFCRLRRARPARHGIREIPDPLRRRTNRRSHAAGGALICRHHVTQP